MSDTSVTANSSDHMRFDDIQQEHAWVDGWSHPSVPGSLALDKSAPVDLPADLAADLAVSPEVHELLDHLRSRSILSPAKQAEADEIIAELVNGYGSPVDGAGAAAFLLDLEETLQVSNDVLFAVIDAVGGPLGDAIRTTLLSGGVSYLDSVFSSGSYSPLTNLVYAESADHQSVYE